MKHVPKKAPKKGSNAISSGKEKRGRKWNSNLNSKVDQTETVSIMMKVDVMYLSIEGLEKSTNVKKKKKK